MGATLKQWREISSGYGDALILGNGASLAVTNCFNYQSLYEEASKLENIDATTTKLFEKFETNDFEQVLWKLAQAASVNSILGIGTEKIERAYESVKGALVKTVHGLHPDQGELRYRLHPIGEFMSKFKTVFVLNYDLLMYWAMLCQNEHEGKTLLKDCWVRGEFREDWSSFRDPIGAATTATLVFYPHGNLVLAGKTDGTEYKVNARGHSPLLKTINSAWKFGNAWPLFVSEGTSDEKISAIGRSRYLSTVLYEVIPEKKKSIVIFGWSMSAADDHILKALKDSSPKSVAISYFSGSDEIFVDYEARIRAKLRDVFDVQRIDFFDSDSVEYFQEPDSPL